MHFQRSKCLPLASAVVAAFVTSTVAQSVNTATAFCSARSVSTASAISQDAYTHAWLNIAEYVCPGETFNLTITDIDTAFEEVAFAIADAFAEVSASCSAQGSAELRAQGYAHAEARATAVGNAVAQILASAEVCGQCTAAVDALSNTTQELVAEAVAEAWTELYLLSDFGSEASNTSTVTSHIITETVATVLSGITGTIRAGVDDGCSIDIINAAQVGDYFAQCELILSGDARVVETDAIASLAVNVSAYACDSSVDESSVDEIARDTARALAEAVAQADAYCEASGGDETMACGLAEADIRAVAHAQAEAFVEASSAAMTCVCEIGDFLSSEFSNFREIWAEAATNAYAETCVSGNNDSFVTEFNIAIEERMRTVTVRAIASAVANASSANGSECRGRTSVCAEFDGECTEGSGVCGGTAFGPTVPCCEPDFRCIKMNDEQFFCRHEIFTPPPFWDGSVAECTFERVSTFESVTVAP